MAKTGAWLQSGMLVGMAVTAFHMIRAFRELQESDAADPSRLSFAIGDTLAFTGIGLVVAAVGWLLILVAVTAGRYRERWVFWFTMILGGGLSMALPPVLIITFAPILYCGLRAKEFLPKRAPHL